MPLSDLKDPEELAGILQLIFGVLAIICLGMGWVVALDSFQHYTYCCGEDGEPYSAPSALVMILSIVLFPLFMIGGIIVIAVTGGFIQAVVMCAIIGAGFALSVYRVALKDKREKARARRWEEEQARNQRLH